MVQVADLMQRRTLCVQGRRPRLTARLPAFARSIRKVLSVLEFTLEHASLGARIRRGLKSHDAVIVSGFMTQFLPLVWLVSLGTTRNVLLLVHHNLQEAFHRPVLRSILALGAHLGYRFLVMETAEGAERLELAAAHDGNFLVIPHPLGPPPADLTPSAGNACPIVGLIGQIRPEKNQGQLLERLIEIRRRHGETFDILVGASELDSLPEEHLSAVRTVDTSKTEDYFSTLAACDVVVIHGQRHRYFYRASGILADAIRSSTLVVGPDYPVFRSQIMWPVSVGEVYSEESDLERALMAALARARPPDSEPFRRHQEARAASAVAVIIDRALAAD